MNATVELEVRPGVRFDPIDEFLIPSLDRDPLPWPETRPFDMQDCLRRTALVKGSPWARGYWDACDIRLGMNYKESGVWLRRFAQTNVETNLNKLQMQHTLDELSKPIEVSELNKLWPTMSSVEPEHLAIVYATLLGTMGMFQMLVERQLRPIPESHSWGNLREHAVVKGAWLTLRPYMTREQLDELRTMVRPYLKDEEWPKTYTESPPVAHHLAAFAGMSNELNVKLRHWPSLTDSEWYELRFGVQSLQSWE